GGCGMVAGFGAAGVSGGVAGGLIVRATWGAGDSGSATATGAAPTTASCDAARVARQALPSVVTINARTNRATSNGSGVVIRAGGYVLTNDHVIAVGGAGGTVSILRGGRR